MKNEFNTESIIMANQLTKEREFWKERLAEFKGKTYFEYDFQYGKGSRYDSYTVNLSQNSIDKLIKLCGTNDLKLQIILTAGVILFLKKLMSEDYVSLGTPIEKQENEEGLINTILPLFYKNDQAISFKELILLSKSILAQSIEHQNFPIHTLLNELDIDSTSSYSTLFDVGMLLKNRQSEIHLQRMNTNIIFSFERKDETVDLSIIFNTGKYQGDTIGYIAGIFDDILEIALLNPNQLLCDIPLLSDEKRKEVLSFLKPESNDYPVNKTIPYLFNQQVNKNTYKIAIACKNEFITFGELDRRSSALANTIISTSKKATGKVMLLLERNIDTIVAMLAVLKSRNSYLIAEIGTPNERIKYLLKDSDTSLIITSEEVYDIITELNTTDCPVIQVNNLTESDIHIGLDEQMSEDLCYTIYTSGSTGHPKGVQISHKNVINHLYGMNDKIFSQHGNYQTMGLVSPFIFDACVQLTFGSLLFGHKLQILTNAEKNDGRKLLESYSKYAINITDGTPTHINLILQSTESTKHLCLKHIVSGGEVLYKSKVQELYGLLNNVKPKITNVYGPTECTVNATYYEISPDNIDEIDEINIGKPFPNYRTYILDENLEPCPIGVSGELCFAGDCITLGYINNVTLTNKKIKYAKSIQDTIYLTGDYARVLHDGDIRFMGRKDDMVKIRGYRVELGEIEFCINSHNEIQQAVVVVRTNESGDSILAAYYSSSNSLSPQALRSYLLDRLPEYMIPSYLLTLKDIPLSPSGKINRKLLPSPSELLSINTGESPINETEEQLLDIWISNLEVQEIGVNENFFNVGGDSIKTISLLYEINEAFNDQFSIIDLYKYDTIRKFSDAIRSKQVEKVVNEDLLEVEDALDQMKKDILKSL